MHARQRQRVREAGRLRQETRRRLQAEARSEGVQNLHVVDDLIDIYVALRLDQSLTDAERQRLAGQVRSRLSRVQERLRKESLDPQRTGGRAVRPSTNRTIVEDGMPENNAPPSAILAAHAARRTADVAVQLSHRVLAQQGIAGPAGAVGGGLFGGAPLSLDYGEELADLIQTVIAPSTWVRSGGPGSIYYYRPLRVLVIRQTGPVHEQIGSVVDDLRQAGN